MHRAQFFVQVIGGEIDAVMPCDRREPVVQIELGEAAAIAQDVEVLAVQSSARSTTPFRPSLNSSQIL
jgi:hypothetical protein